VHEFLAKSQITNTKVYIYIFETLKNNNPYIDYLEKKLACNKNYQNI